MYIRAISSELDELSKTYPVITVIGPRQSGKTTLVKTHFKNYKYCSLENPDYRKYASEDPRAFLKEFNAPVIFDEIQRVPELLSYIQGIVDDCSDKAQYILTGSHQLELRAQVTQSLAGRTALLTLLPLSLDEIIPTTALKSKEEFLLKGMYPRVHNDDLNPTKAYRNYYQTYIERDVRQLIQLKDITLFEKFIHLLAGRVGQILNLNSISNDVGVSSTTLKEWLSVLEASFIIKKLKPYHENFGKRVIKSSKIYFVDTGLLCSILGIEDVETLKHYPLIGNIFENFVIMEAFKIKYNKGEDPNLYFFRDSAGKEVDLIYQKNRDLIPIEIKSSQTYNSIFEKGIKFFKSTSGSKSRGYVIYDGEFCPENNDVKVLNYKNLATVFET